MTGRDKRVPVNGSGRSRPIATLVETLLAQPVPKPDAAETSATERAYAASIRILREVCPESRAMRLRFFSRHHAADSEKTALGFLTNLHPALPCQEKLLEVFALRDILARNRVREIDFSWDSTCVTRVDQAGPASGSGDWKHAECVDSKTRRARKSGLSAVPLDIDRTDVRKAIGTVWTALVFLEADDDCASGRLAVKRVIAGPGTRIEMRANRVTIDGVPLEYVSLAPQAMARISRESERREGSSVECGPGLTAGCEEHQTGSA